MFFFIPMHSVVISVACYSGVNRKPCAEGGRGRVGEGAHNRGSKYYNSKIEGRHPLRIHDSSTMTMYKKVHTFQWICENFEFCSMCQHWVYEKTTNKEDEASYLILSSVFCYHPFAAKYVQREQVIVYICARHTEPINIFIYLLYSAVWRSSRIQSVLMLNLLRTSSNVGLFLSRTKFSELSSWRDRRLTQLSSIDSICVG